MHRAHRRSGLSRGSRAAAAAIAAAVAVLLTSAAGAAAPTATTTSVAVTPVVHGLGAASTATATVRDAAGHAGVGRVAFYLDNVLFSVPSTNGAGVVSVAIPASASIARHVVTARFLPPAGSPDATSVGAKAFDVTRGLASVSGTASVVAYRSTGSVTVAVRGPAPASGMIFLLSGGTVVDHRSLDSLGRAVLQFQATGRPAALSIAYSGNAALVPVTVGLSAPVSRAASGAAISVSTNGVSAAVTVSVYGVAGGASPTGSMAVTVDGRVAAQAPFVGAASVTLGGLSAGNHVIGAGYSGDFLYLPATAASRSITIVPPVNPCPVSARACVDLTHSLTWLQSDGHITYGPVAMSSGRPGYRTDPGSFSVQWKDKHHYSLSFFAPMPNAVFFNGGDAFHLGNVAVESHGCIHLSAADSEYYFDTLQVGDRVSVFGVAPY